MVSCCGSSCLIGFVVVAVCWFLCHGCLIGFLVLGAVGGWWILLWVVILCMLQQWMLLAVVAVSCWLLWQQLAGWCSSGCFAVVAVAVAAAFC